MECKFCCRCETEKEVSFFGKSSKNKDGLHSWCKSCVSAARMRRYYENHEIERENGNRRANEARLKLKRQLWDYLLDNPCVDCGEADPVVLEFDHVDPTTKVGTIAELSRGYFKWSSLLKEIEKCEVRCANCHRRRTAIQFDWFVG